MSWFDILLVISVLLLFLISYIKNRQKYWEKKNVPYLKPNIVSVIVPDFISKGISAYEMHKKFYDELAPHKYGGFLKGLKPILMPRDPEIIKNILTRDFQYFMDRNTEFVTDEPLTHQLFSLQGDEWRTLRNKLSPTFTSGKIKIMFNLMKECSQQLVDKIGEVIEGKEELEIRDLMARFTTDIISSCVFGVVSNALKDENSEMRTMGKKIFEMSFRLKVYCILIEVYPKLRKLLHVSFMSPDVVNFFVSTVTNIIKNREENNLYRGDFLDLLISLRKQEMLKIQSKTKENEELMEFTDDLLTSQCFVFFVAGFENTSGTLSFALLELAKNEEIQNKLYHEIAYTIKENNDELSYECLQKMFYLDIVVKETLRLYPIVPILYRECKKTFVWDNDVVLEKGTELIIPVLGLHRDPLHYPNPNQFNPENFSKDAIASRHQYAYLPFGEGPRICIGNRFALMQIKLGIASIIRDYTVSLSPKMKKNWNFLKATFTGTVESGVWLEFHKRNFV